jgi:hypothetical protein
MKMKILMASAALITLGGAPAHAETVTTKTVVQQEEMPGVNKINLTAFDVNEDGTLSMQEVGERLFRLFDRDGNHSIDNIEWDTKAIMTIIPMEQQTLKFVDLNDDGNPEVVEHTEATFLKDSHLMRFDDNKDGLTPKEFIGKGYENLDDDQDKLINLEEWKEAYMESLHSPVNEPEKYQQ